MKRKEMRTVASGDPLVLGAFLKARLSTEEAESLVRTGCVRVDGKRALDPMLAIAPGNRVIVFLSDTVEDTPALTVRYRDREVLVVEKPAGLLTEASPTESQRTLVQIVALEEPDARALHRLDRDASGLVLFARTESARVRLSKALQAHEIERRYTARVSGRLDGEGVVRLAIGTDGKDTRKRCALPEGDPAGEPALSHYRALGHGGDFTTVTLRLETGRTHQLRVHLAAIGHPIFGDTLYGGPVADRLYLHAHELVFPHPRSGTPCTVQSPLPDIFSAP